MTLSDRASYRQRLDGSTLEFASDSNEDTVEAATLMREVTRTTSRCRPACNDSKGHAWQRAIAAAPGLAVVAGGTVAAYGIAHVVPSVNPSSAAVVVGALLVNLRLHHPVLHAGTHVAAHRLLRAAVVLLGLQLSLSALLHLGATGIVVVAGTVVVTFFGTQAIGRLLGIPPARRLLIATGFSICGASAVAAMEEVAGGDEDDTAIAIALVTLCGSLAILLLPALRSPLGLNPTAFGSWVGASVHDVGQTVATANRVHGALTSAVVVKLSRVILLAPLVAGVALRRARRGGTAATGRRPPLLPLFVAGFLLMIGIASTGILPAGVLAAAKAAQGILLAAALVGLGTGIHLPTLLRTGGRALVLGALSWVLVAGVSYAGVVTLGR